MRTVSAFSAMTLQQTSKRLTISVAEAAERKAIYQVRHEVYARELGQHGTNSSGCLRDSLDERNLYLVVKAQDEIAGFISITPPTRATYSIDKYFSRDKLSFPFDERLFEVRLLTVLKPQRGGKRLLCSCMPRYVGWKHTAGRGWSLLDGES